MDDCRFPPSAWSENGTVLHAVTSASGLGLELTPGNDTNLLKETTYFAVTSREFGVAQWYAVAADDEQFILTGAVVAAEAARLKLTAADGGEDRHSLHYDPVYDRPASLPLWEGTWVVVRNGISVDTMTVAIDGGFLRQHINECAGNGPLSVLDPHRNLYELQDDVADCRKLDDAYTGFVDVDPLGGSANDRALLLVMAESGTILLTTTFFRHCAMLAGDGPEGEPEDQHGSTRDTANSVDVPSNTAGALAPDDADDFNIRPSVAGTLQVYTSGSIGTLGILEHADGSEMDIDDDSGEVKRFGIERQLANGLYDVRVTVNPSTTAGDCTLRVRLVEE